MLPPPVGVLVGLALLLGLQLVLVETLEADKAVLCLQQYQTYLTPLDAMRVLGLTVYS